MKNKLFTFPRGAWALRRGVEPPSIIEIDGSYETPWSWRWHDVIMMSSWYIIIQWSSNEEKTTSKTKKKQQHQTKKKQHQTKKKQHQTKKKQHRKHEKVDDQWHHTHRICDEIINNKNMDLMILWWFHMFIEFTP